MTSKAKENAARKMYTILRELIPRASSIGIGTGSTVRLVLQYLLSDPDTRSTLEARDLYASSMDTLLFLEENGLHASLFLPATGLDIYFDGADEVAIHSGKICQAVKGRGAAHTLEKIYAYSSRTVYLVIDDSKLSKNLGEKGKPVPVETHPAAYRLVRSILESQGVRVEERKCNCRDGPTVTDSGGLVLDTWPWKVYDPYRYEGVLDTIPGVIGHGLFIGYMDYVVVGSNGGASVYECKRTRKAHAKPAVSKRETGNTGRKTPA